jgi:hypothetical protein
MNLLTSRNIPPPRSNETVFRISLSGPLFTFLIFLIGLLIGVALFIYCYLSSVAWGMVLSGIYVLMMWGICHVLFRALVATLSPANWLARIGFDGMLLKYRSYLHDDSPAEDPVALQLSWPEIADAQLQQELYTTTDIDEKRQVQRWFLVLELDARYLDIDRISSALAFEKQRKPAHFKVDDLKHELFNARKNRADKAEIARIKREIALEKKRHPGKHSKTHFHDRPVVFIEPDQLKMEWTHITPGKKKLRRLLAQHTTVTADGQQQFDIEKPMTETEFNSLLAGLLGRDETIEAIKLVRLHLGLNTTEARAFIEKAGQ